MTSHKKQRGSIVFAVPDYLPSLGGTTTQTQNQAKSCIELGLQPIVLTQRIDRSLAKREMVEGTEVVRIGPASRHRFAMKIFVLRAAVWMRLHRPTIEIVNVVMYPDLAVSARLAGIQKQTIICWAGLGDATDSLGQSGNRSRRVLIRMRRYLLREVSHVVLTGALKDELSRLEITERVHLIPTQVDTQRFHPPSPTTRSLWRAELGIATNEVAVIYVGHLRELKRVDRLVEAFDFAYAHIPELRLYIVGGSREDLEDRTQELMTQVESLGLVDVVSVVGAVADVERYMGACDIFVLPSEREGLSNSVLEAMATGLACVVPLTAGGDQVLTEETGIITVSNSALELATAISSLATDGTFRRSLGEAAAVAAIRYSSHSVGASYFSLYDSLRRT